MRIGDTFKNSNNVIVVIMDISNTGIVTFMLSNPRYGIRYTTTTHDSESFDKFIKINNYKKI